jgi:large subunit ribosomal protein L19
MSELLTKISARSVKPRYTEVAVGDTVRVFTRIQEGEKTRTQYFDGLIIRRRGGVGPNASFTVRRIASGVGVERTFALHSPTIEKIEILRTAKVRRARLYTMRGLTGKAARLTEKKVDREARDIEHPWTERYGLISEKVKAEASSEETAASPTDTDEPTAAAEETLDKTKDAKPAEKADSTPDASTSEGGTDAPSKDTSSTADSDETEAANAADGKQEK